MMSPNLIPNARRSRESYGSCESPIVWTDFRITESDRVAFERDGYWISPVVIEPARVAALRRAQERIWSCDYDGNGFPMDYKPTVGDPEALRMLDNGWWINDEIRSMVTDPVVGSWAADFMAVDTVKLWHDQVLYKPPVAKGSVQTGNVGWHQDRAYWQCCDTDNMITAQIALQDTDVTNGAMMVVRGSHRYGLVRDSNTFFERDLESLRMRYGRDRPWEEVVLTLKSGQLSFHHSLTFHGSGPNLSQAPRMTIAAHLMAAGTRYWAGVRFHSRVKHANVRFLGPRPEDGQCFDGVYFPTVYTRP
jgi:ectoine hydroxylase-related dioxygenase (phytanoyl-CoA dioxygenase family)